MFDNRSGVIRVWIARKQDGVVGCFYIMIKPDRNGIWKVVYQDPIAAWRHTSRRGMLASSVWRNWARFKFRDYATRIEFVSIYDKQRECIPQGITFDKIFPSRPQFVRSQKKDVEYNARRSSRANSERQQLSRASDIP